MPTLKKTKSKEVIEYKNGLSIPLLNEQFTDLNFFQLAVFCQISDLSKIDNCIASNEELALLFRCSISTVNRVIQELIELEYIEVVKNDGRLRYIDSNYLFVAKKTYKKKRKSGSMKRNKL